MSEWSYLAKIIKEAKKAGKASGKRKAIYKHYPKLEEFNSKVHDDMTGYNQQLRNYINSEQTEGPLSKYTQNAAADLYDTLEKQPYELPITKDFKDTMSQLQQSANYNDLIGYTLNDLDIDDYIDPTHYYRKLQNPLKVLDTKEKNLLDAINYTNYINKQKSLGKNVAPLEDLYLDEPFDVNEAARDILEEKAAKEGRKLNGEFKLERPDGSGW